MALDFLDQHSIHLYWWNIYRNIFEVRQDQCSPYRKDEGIRLGRNESLPYIDNRISYPHHPRWCRMPLELMAYACTTLHLHCWTDGVCLAPGVCGQKPVHSYWYLQKPVCINHVRANNHIWHHSIDGDVLPSTLFRGSKEHVARHGWCWHVSMDFHVSSNCNGMSLNSLYINAEF